LSVPFCPYRFVPYHFVLEPFLVFDDDIGTALFKACSKDFDQDAICLSRAAEIVRHDIFGDGLLMGLSNMLKTVYQILCLPLLV